jgi:hypothetical protein
MKIIVNGLIWMNCLVFDVRSDLSNTFLTSFPLDQFIAAQPARNEKMGGSHCTQRASYTFVQMIIKIVPPQFYPNLLFIDVVPLPFAISPKI